MPPPPANQTTRSCQVIHERLAQHLLDLELSDAPAPEQPNKQWHLQLASCPHCPDHHQIHHISASNAAVTPTSRPLNSVTCLHHPFPPAFQPHHPPFSKFHYSPSLLEPHGRPSSLRLQLLPPATEMQAQRPSSIKYVEKSGVQMRLLVKRILMVHRGLWMRDRGL